jgi:lipopolysaccharide biosynthesis regulator YciM
MEEQGIRAVNCVIDVWEVDDESAFETHMTSCGLYRPTGSV